MVFDESIEDEDGFFAPGVYADRQPGLVSRIKKLLASLFGIRSRSAQTPPCRIEKRDYLTPVEIVRIRFGSFEQTKSSSAADIASSVFLALRVLVRSLIIIAVLFGLGYLLLTFS